jgi:hypothetical protein
MIFSRRAVELIVENCQCQAPDTPDDMYIGACIRQLDIKFIHSDLLHQVINFLNLLLEMIIFCVCP